MSLYERVAELPLEIESYALERLEHAFPHFTRVTTVVRLRGGGEAGVGEDVTYDGDAQTALQEAGPTLPLAGSWTLDSFSEHVEALELWPHEPGQGAFRDYRRWGFESAALDLALRQAGRSLGEEVGREPRPVRFVVSGGLGAPPSTQLVRSWLEHYPGLQFKLDARSDWTGELVAELAELGAVESVDLKGFYSGTVVDQPADPALYRRVVEGLDGVWIEDPALTPETEPILEPYRDRITWDAPIHSVADIEGLPFPPRTINVKPSRFGSVRRLFDTYDYCDARGIGAYGGGQSELGPGRGQIQYLASLFHSDAANDVAPGGFNMPPPRPGLPASPLAPAAEPIGFRWSSEGSLDR